MSRTREIGVVIVGAGVVSKEYLTTLKRSPVVRIDGIFDVDPVAVRKRAHEFDVPVVDDLGILMGRGGTQIAVNLTPPRLHHAVTRNLLEQGFDVWSEKPVASTSAEAEDLIKFARSQGRQLRCAPDTLLGPAFQIAQRLVEEGCIGRPVSAFATLQSPGPDRWHPNPEFLFQPGGGPLRDIGPYYLTAMFRLLGAVDSVWAQGGSARSTRTVNAGPRLGESFPVDVATDVQFGLAFRSGTSAVGIFSWDSAIRRKGVLEITGTTGSLRLADPNTFSGAVTIVENDEDETVIESTDDGMARGLGVHRWAETYETVDDSSALLGLDFLMVVEAIERAERTGGVEPVASDFGYVHDPMSP